ncbi:MAG: hypothetical protein Tsb009_14550 [Planctomycetaceae bacterium]
MTSRARHASGIEQIRKSQTSKPAPGRKSRYSIFDRKMFPRTAEEVNRKEDPFLREANKRPLSSEPPSSNSRRELPRSDAKPDTPFKPSPQIPAPESAPRIDSTNPFATLERRKNQANTSNAQPAINKPDETKNPFELIKSQQARESSEGEETVPCLDDEQPKVGKSNFVPEFEAAMNKLRREMAVSSSSKAEEKNPFAQVSSTRTSKPLDSKPMETVSPSKSQPSSGQLGLAHISDHRKQNPFQVKKSATEPKRETMNTRNTAVSRQDHSLMKSDLDRIREELASYAERRKSSKGDSSMIVDSDLVPSPLERTAVSQELFQQQQSEPVVKPKDIKIIPRNPDKSQKSIFTTRAAWQDRATIQTAELKNDSSSHGETSHQKMKLASLQRPVLSPNNHRGIAPLPPAELPMPNSSERLSGTQDSQLSSVELENLNLQTSGHPPNEEAAGTPAQSVASNGSLWVIAILISVLAVLVFWKRRTASARWN